MERTEELKTDVLVLGGGIAGCFAAIKARELGLDVILVDKGAPGRSGLSPCISGVLSYFDAGQDDYDAFYHEAVVESGEWLNDQECLEGMFEETADRIREMESWGVRFQKDSAGRFVRKRGLQINQMNVSLSRGGLQMMLVLRGEVLRRGVRTFERVMVTDLLTSDSEEVTSGRVVGAVGFNVRTGKFYVFRAKATVIATGGTHAVQLRCVHPHLSGDGRAMAYRVGAQMRNFDLISIGPRLRDFAGPIGPGLQIFAMEGVHFINARCERIMEKYDPVRLERAKRPVISLAIAAEEREGRGPVYVDARHLSPASLDAVERALPLVVNTLASVGQSFRKHLIPYTVDIQDVIAGGIRVNKGGATTVPGLYCAGDASDHADMGANEFVAQGIASANVGHRAGEAAATYALETDEPSADQRQVRALIGQVFAPLKRDSGLRHHEVRAHCKTILERGLLGPIKNAKGLQEAITIAGEIGRDEVPRLAAKDYHDLARCLGVRNELVFLDLMARCSLIRTESRGPHYREDYPQKDDANWLKWVVAKRRVDSTNVWTEAIPFEKYRLRPASGTEAKG
ncbi:MAG: FAD-binding protein [Chloroflexi bacterium]|nr:FAD-binding protein [Chloroflexota bacterium]